MFQNVYLPVQEVTVGIQTDFEDKCRVTRLLSMLQARQSAASVRRRCARITHSVHSRTAALLQQLVQDAFTPSS